MLQVRGPGETKWRSPRVTAFDDEAALQTLVANAPYLLPGSDGHMAVITEVPVSTIGWADIVGVDQAGTITLVECKLKANREIRRQVVGQILAYAAGLAGLSYEAFDALFISKHCGPLIEQFRKPASDGDAWDEQGFRSQVTENLKKGNFRLIIAVDEITDELKAVVHYLNEHTVSDMPFLALELHYAKDGCFEVLVPQTYGEEGKSPQPPSSKWNEQSLLDALQKVCTPDGFVAVKRLYEYAKNKAAGFNWGNGKLALGTARFTLNGKQVSALSFYEFPEGNGAVAINFDYMRSAGVPIDKLATLAERLHHISGVPERLAGLEQAGYKRNPSLSIDTILAERGALETIEKAFDELLGHAGSQPNG